MQIPILSGVYADNGPDVRVSYPVNLVPTVAATGISAGYLRPADGIVVDLTAEGIGRGGIEWRGNLYRVMGADFIRIFYNASGEPFLETIGTVDNDFEPVRMVYGFDFLAIASAGKLYLFNETTLTQVTDVDLGAVVDVEWVDGYFMTTDGDSLVVTELNDPFSVNPLKYGSSESDPDPVLALLRLRNEVYALNRNTIEVFANVGGDLFPFQRIDGAKITKGTIGTHACCVFLETIAFVGGGRNEAPGVYLGVNASATKISTPEIDRLLRSFTDAQLSKVVLETRNDNGHEHLYVHLLDRTAVYDASASRSLGEPVWFYLTSTLDGFGGYAARYFVWAYDQWNFCSPINSDFGRLVRDVSTKNGLPVRWEFSTGIIYAEGRGAIVNELELVALTGRVSIGKDPAIATSHSSDGVVWSQERTVKAGKVGDRMKRLVWQRCGQMRHWRIQRFRGTSDAHVSFLRLEASIEGLAY